MKRLHVNLTVADLDRSVHFYSVLFASEPTVLKSDYAKWMLEDPRVNFAISTRGASAGLDHFGIQVDSRDELHDLTRRLDAAGRAVSGRGEAHCCYAHSDKGWVADPQGLSWEAFFTFGSASTYGEDRGSPAGGETTKSACCSEACCPDRGA